MLDQQNGDVGGQRLDQALRCAGCRRGSCLASVRRAAAPWACRRARPRLRDVFARRAKACRPDSHSCRPTGNARATRRRASSAMLLADTGRKRHRPGFEDLRGKPQIFDDRQIEEQIGDLERARESRGLHLVGRLRRCGRHRRPGYVPRAAVAHPEIRLNSVDLPAPFGPMMVVMRLRSTLKLTLSTARRPPKAIDRPFASRTGASRTGAVMVPVSARKPWQRSRGAPRPSDPAGRRSPRP